MDGTSKPSAGDKQFLYERICQIIKLCTILKIVIFHLTFYEPSGKGDNKMDQKASNDLAQTLSLFLEVPNLRDCVSISTVVHATISYLFSRHFPAFSVPRPILKVQNY